MIEFPLRTVVDLNRGWEFSRGKVRRKWSAGIGTADETVDLPHCWNNDDTYQYEVSSYRGHGAYRRWFELPREVDDGAWYLVSDGFYGIGEIHLDGRRVGNFDAQYLGFEIPLPPSVDRAAHLLSIRLDNRYHRNVLPGKKDPDFLLYGGLVGAVRVERRPWPRIDRRATTIRCRQAEDGAEIVTIRSSVSAPHESSKNATVRWSITTVDGRPVAESAANSAADAHVVDLRVPDPSCWSPEHPDLYHAIGRLEVDGRTSDEIRLRFGITRTEFRPGEGLFLNEARVDLHGANRHESIPGLGSALSPALHKADARLLKQYGANLVRLSHYPQHPSFLDACDELGIFVYPEVASWKSVSGRSGWRRAALRQLRTMIVRDRHRPSILLWGMGNESRSRRTYTEMRDLVGELDPGRPVSYAENHLYRARRQKTVGIPQIWSTNYELDVLDGARDASGWKLVLLSECCNHPASVRGDEMEELTQVAAMEREWEIMDERPYLLGHAVWSLTDYATEHRNRTRRQAGLFDAWRQPKMAAELFRARYSNAPFISVYGVRTRRGAPASRFRTEIADPRGGGSTHRLHIFSNCRDLRILQDGNVLKSLEATLHTVIPVDPDRGNIEIEGIREGTAVSARWEPGADAAAIRLLCPAHGSYAGPVMPLNLRVVDAAGGTATSWNGHVRVRARGGVRVLAYTDTGEVLVTRGEGRVYVEVDPSNVEPAAAAEAVGLESAELILGAAGS